MKMRESALSKGYTDAIRMSREGKILETSKGNLFFLKGNSYVTPIQKGILPGIVRQKMISALEKDDLIECRDILLEDLPGMEEAYVTNSLVGVAPVEVVSNTSYTVNWERVRNLNSLLGGAYSRRFHS